MRARACPQCADAGAWIITLCHEQNLVQSGPVEPLETHICDRCGYAVWYSGAIDDLREELGRVARVDDERLACLDCDGRRHFLVMRSGQAGDGPGRFALLFCGGCGRGQWYAWGGAAGAARHADERCPRCRAVGRSAVALPGAPPIGHFDVHFCDACGYCEWHARAFQRLQRDGERVRHIEAKERAFAPVAGGPYR
jgi:hypothetical protein